MRGHPSAFAPVTLWPRPLPGDPEGKRHKTCHPASRRGPPQPSSYVNVSACADSRVRHISLNMHVQHGLERKHLYAQASVHLCVCVCFSWLVVCMSELMLLCYSDIPSGKEPGDRFHLPDCPYLFTGRDCADMTSDFTHTRWVGGGGVSLCPSPSLSPRVPASLRESLLCIRGNDLYVTLCLTQGETLVLWELTHEEEMWKMMTCGRDVIEQKNLIT